MFHESLENAIFVQYYSEFILTTDNSQFSERESKYLSVLSFGKTLF